MCDLRQVLQPNEKLQKMLGFLKFILILNLISAILRIFINPSDMLYDLFCTLFLFLAYNTVYFIYAAIYMIFSLVNAVYLFVSCGTVLQMYLQGTLGEFGRKAPLFLGISLYLLIFYIFALMIVFPAYKEMKAQLMDSFRGPENTLRLNSNPSNNRSNNDEEIPAPAQNRGFVAFSGSGVAVGGGSR